MYTESRKIHLLEEVLKITNEATLVEIESVVNKSKKSISAKQKSCTIDFSFEPNQLKQNKLFNT